MQPTLHWVSSGEFKDLWGQDLVTLLWLLQKKPKKTGKLGCAQHMRLFLCARSYLGRESRPFRGLLTAWYRGHVQRLAHGIGNYADRRLAWSQVQYRALLGQAWVTKQIPHQFLNLYLQGRISWAFLFSSQQPASLFMQLYTSAYVSCAGQPGLLPTHQGVGRGMLLKTCLNRGWKWCTDCLT